MSRWIHAIVLGAGLAVGFGCNLGPSEAAKSPIRIGASMSLTGKYAGLGNYVQQGYRLWVKHVNTRGGMHGRPVELTIYDDKSDAQTSVYLYQQLILQEKMDLVLGPFGSPNAMVVSTVTEKLGYPLLVYAASEEIWKRGYRYVFGMAPPAAHYLDGALAVAKQHGLKRIAVITAGTDIGLRGMALGILEAAPQMGFRIIFYEEYPKDTKDFSWLLAKIKAARPEVLLVAAYVQDEIQITRQLKKFNFMPKLYAVVQGGLLPEFGAALGPDAEDILGASHWEPYGSLGLPGMQPFIEAFQREFGRLPNGMAAFGYAAGQVLETAATKVGSLDREKIRDALATLDMVTVYGRYKVDKDGLQIGRDVLLVQWQRGKKEIIWPERYASAKLVYPIPPWTARE